MTVCRNEAMNKDNAYPKSCPICKWSGVCAKGVEPDPASGIDPKYYIPVASNDGGAKFAVFYADTIYHEGDQRSRDCLGHGYPAYPG